MRRLTTREKLVYSTGNLGTGISNGLSVFWLVYFFFPPESAGIPYVIPQDSIFLGLTVIGLILAANRLLDAFTDPWVASICHKSKNPNGKYIPMMRWASFGVMLFLAAMFYIPDPENISTINVVWLSLAIALQAFFATMYNIPYFSLQVKLAPHPDDIVDIGTIAGATWFTGFVISSFASVFWEFYGSAFDLDKQSAIQLTIMTLSFVGFLAYLVPAFLLKESDYKALGDTDNDTTSFLDTIKFICNDKIYVRFQMIIGLYGISTFMFETGLIYFLTVLAEMPENNVGLITSITGVLTLLCYPIVNKLAKKYGKKSLLSRGFFIFGFCLIFVSLIGIGSIPPVVMIGLLVLLAPFSQAIMAILPGAIGTDISAYACRRSGSDKSSVYTAGTLFINKLVVTVGSLLFTSFLLFGKDIGDDLGIRVIALTSLSLCFMAYFLSKTYNEEEVMRFHKGYKGDEIPEQGIVSHA